MFQDGIEAEFSEARRMKVRILGCSGGIGGPHLRTTSMQVDEDILIDTVIDMRARPLTVYGTEETLDALRRHIFNWEIWPDFSVVPSVEKPFMRFETLSVDDTIVLGTRRVTVLPAQHTVPAVGYHLASPEAGLAYTGDTGPCPELWDRINRMTDLRYLIIETAFPDRDRKLAEVSGHLCPGMLADELAKMRVPAEVYITHLKPGQVELTMNEVLSCTGSRAPRMLQDDQVFVF
jgi:phosphoribosyl 1,2-cyclic phosphodiesterase